MVRAFQVNAEPPAWKMFNLDKVGDDILILPDTFAGARPGYKVGDSAMTKILAQLPAPEPVAA